MLFIIKGIWGIGYMLLDGRSGVEERNLKCNSKLKMPLRSGNSRRGGTKRFLQVHYSTERTEMEENKVLIGLDDYDELAAMYERVETVRRVYRKRPATFCLADALDILDIKEIEQAERMEKL